VLDEADEAVADGVGLAAVEAEDELAEVALQVLGPDGAVVGAEEPALGEAEDEVDGGQPQAGVAPAGSDVDRLVPVALGGKAAIAGPAVCMKMYSLGTSKKTDAPKNIHKLEQPEPTGKLEHGAGQRHKHAHFDYLIGNPPKVRLSMYHASIFIQPTAVHR
jgi:hypothetical protein